MPLSKTELAAIVKDFVNRLSKDIPVEKTYLFGSYATGTPTETSDIDLAVVSPYFENRKHIENMKYLSKIAAKCNSLIEALPFTKEETDNPDKRTLVYQIVTKGKLVTWPS